MELLFPLLFNFASWFRVSIDLEDVSRETRERLMCSTSAKLCVHYLHKKNETTLTKC